MPDFIDRTHHLPVDGIVQYLFDEAAVDLQVIDREVLEIAERRQPGAEIIERELAAQFLQRLNEAIRLREARDRRRLRDFEADLGGIQAAAVDRKSTRLNSSHANISYAVFCLKKKKKKKKIDMIIIQNKIGFIYH